MNTNEAFETLFTCSMPVDVLVDQIVYALCGIEKTDTCLVDGLIDR